MSRTAPSWRPPRALLRWATISGCVLLIGAAGVALALLARRLAPILIPLVLTTLLARVLILPADALARRGWGATLRAAAVLGTFLVVAALAVTAIAIPLADQVSDVVPAAREGIDDIEAWLVDDAPIDLDRRDVAQGEEAAGEAAREAFVGPEGNAVATGARWTLRIAAALLLTLILTYFALRDGPKLQGWVLSKLRPALRPRAQAMAAAAWGALGGYLRGAAILGLVEGAIIGVAMAVAGADLALPVALLTFLAAFVPLVGAIAAGIVAVLVTLASAGLGPALAVGVVAVAVQQLDNDLLAPWIYHQALRLHPATILVSITTGTALFGVAGTVLAVPVTAVATSAWRAAAVDETGPPDESVTPGAANGPG